MRELSRDELNNVSGGNGGFLSVVGAYYTGKAIGQSVNDFNARFSMPLGRAIYFALN